MKETSDNHALFGALLVLACIVIFGFIAWVTGVTEWLFGVLLGLGLSQQKLRRKPSAIEREPAVKEATKKAEEAAKKAEEAFNQETSEARAAAPLEHKKDLSSEIDNETEL